MRIIILFVSILFVCSTVLQAQPPKIEIKTTKDYKLKGSVRKLVNNATDIILKFTPEGYLQFFGGFLKDGELQGNTYAYDKAGRMLKDYNSWTKYTHIYSYNSQGQMVEDKQMEGPKCKAIVSFLYDMHGNARQETLDFTNGVKAIYTLKNRYDSQKRLIKIERFEPYDKVPITTDIAYLPNGWIKYTKRDNSSQTVEEYDNKGRLRSSSLNLFSTKENSKISKKYDDNDNLVASLSDRNTSTLYTYNDQRELIVQEDIAVDGSKTKITYTYTKHDVKGNWTERIKDKNGEQTTETRTIEYYY